ncbi:related to ATP dependent RNA helicase of the DEAD-box family [Pseudozyma flocculosa]|uniref:RNA helicase n=1 Tax=Pseudozyma flocculosa TaxID=84751 RepID=A0A5C3F2W6_9BASI|nr:related to ATP dependent RNA helicase of the DEAD-box family [Pseudozyma flocculosa]
MSHSPPTHTHVAAAAERAVDDHADDHTQAAPSSSKQPTAQHGFNAFAHLLDPRILRSLAALGFGSPTPVQKEAIPLALAGKDILARASTGSGKTLAYGLPVLQKVIDAKKSLSRSDPAYQATRAVVLVPTRELSEQVTGQIGALLEYCRDQVSIANIARDASSSVQKLLLSERPDIVVATPSRALAYLQSKSLHLAASLESLVIDEADLILSYGHDDDVRALLGGGFLPKSFQSYLMSATMTSDVQKLKGLVMRNPAILKVQDDVATASNLTQYYATVSEEDKFLLTYVILKLRLIKGKCILFVNDVDRCYRLRLFLEQFGLRSVVLNKELPINSRFHIVQEFNKGVYDYLIATDETSIRTAERDDDDEEGEEKGADASDDDDDNDNATAEAKQSDEDPTATPSKKRKRDAAAKSAAADVASSSKSKNGGGGTGTGTGKSAEFGVSRGIDFVAVSCVINFDLPTSVRSYTHRVGRTARAGATGTSLSFVVPADMVRKHKIIASPTSALDAKVWPRIERAQRARGGVKEWKFDKKQVEGFRYRMQDALRSVTKLSIREARIRELKEEVLKSEKLKAFFEDNPTDLAYLRHDKILGKQTRLQAHMKHVPSYLRPRIVGIKPSPSSSSSSINEGAGKDGEVGFVAKKAKTQPPLCK